MQELVLRIKKTHPDAIIPTKGHFEDAGFDLYSITDRLLSRGEITTIKTGICVSIPKGYVGLIWEKSGLAYKGIEVHGGVIDSGYKGEIMVMMRRSLSAEFYNEDICSSEEYEIKKGQKIAQLLIQKIPLHVSFEEVDDLESTERGVGGFGSTGE